MNSPPENIPAPEKHLLFVGFGDIAERLARDIYGDGWLIKGLCRSRKSSLYAELQQGDAADRLRLQEALKDRPAQILVTLTPDERTPQAYASTYLQSAEALVRACTDLSFAPHIIFVSSTAVYGQDDGSKVDEDSEVIPILFNGQILREAEKLLEESQLPLSILRFSGIYGRQHLAIRDRLREGGDNFRPLRWTNRIHIGDVVGAIKFVLSRYRSTNDPLGRLLCSDLQPEQEGTIENWLRAQLELQPLQFSVSDMPGGKKCDSSRLLGLGYRFATEGFRAGYLEGL